jgi:hypothetical protein
VWASTGGRAVEHFGALETVTPADFGRLFQTNAAGQLFVTQAAVAAMTDGGRVVLSSSVSARHITGTTIEADGGQDLQQPSRREGEGLAADQVAVAVFAQHRAGQFRQDLIEFRVLLGGPAG